MPDEFLSDAAQALAAGIEPGFATYGLGGNFISISNLNSILLTMLDIYQFKDGLPLELFKILWSIYILELKFHGGVVS